MDKLRKKLKNILTTNDLPLVSIETIHVALVTGTSCIIITANKAEHFNFDFSLSKGRSYSFIAG